VRMPTSALRTATPSCRLYRDLHVLAVEHQRLAAIAVEGDLDDFRQELARHFPSALQARG
jgi:hypothetical protein